MRRKEMKRKGDLHRRKANSLLRAGAVLAGVVQAETRANAGFCRNGSVFFPGRSRVDSKVCPAVRRDHKRDHLLRALSSRRDIYPVRGHVVSAGTVARFPIIAAGTIQLQQSFKECSLKDSLDILYRSLLQFNDRFFSTRLKSGDEAEGFEWSSVSYFPFHYP